MILETLEYIQRLVQVLLGLLVQWTLIAIVSIFLWEFRSEIPKVCKNLTKPKCEETKEEVKEIKVKEIKVKEIKVKEIKKKNYGIKILYSKISKEPLSILMELNLEMLAIILMKKKILKVVIPFLN